MLKSLNASRKVAESWVHDNVTRYFNAGNRVRIELLNWNLASEVRVVVPSSFDSFFSESGRPSSGHFRADLNKTMIELLSFLTKHHSPFFVTISPFLSFHQNKNISLDFSLFKDTAQAHKDRRRTYRNSFDLIYDTLASALSSVGFSDVDIVVSKIGWPTDGAANATSATAEAFLKGMMGHLQKKTGTLLRPPVETYIESLLDEDQRNVSLGNFERHWGVFTFDGQAKYSFSFNHNSKKLVSAQNIQYLPSKWCVVNNNRDMSNASAKALEACSVSDCTSILPGGSCSAISWPGNVSYAFNNLYQQNDHRAESCDFGGLGLITTVDPSEDNCRFLIQLDTSHSSSQIPMLFQSWFLLLFFLLFGTSLKL